MAKPPECKHFLCKKKKLEKYAVLFVCQLNDWNIN